MIEIVSAEACTGCDICVAVCPTRVFDAVPGGIPVIARQSDCQTCFLCEVWCPADALYVAPMAEPASDRQARSNDLALTTGPALAGLAASPTLAADPAAQARAWQGSYRRAIGWQRGVAPLPDYSYELLGRVR